MHTRLKITTVVTALGIGAAGCGGGHHAATASPAMEMPSSAAVSGPPVATDTVAIKNFAFAPAAVTVRAGTTVTWTNDDEEAHTVTTASGPVHSKALAPGATFAYRFAKPGTYHYICTIHPYMQGTVTVTR